MPESRSIMVAVLQPALRWGQAMPNMLHLRKLVDELPAAVRLVVLPEGWAGVSPDDPQLAEHAGRGRQFLQTLARSAGACMVGGGMQRPGADGRVENVCCVVSASGEVVGEYVKRILFGREQDSHHAGAAPLVVEVDGVRLAPLICADVWRPALAAELVERADLVCVPARTAVPSDLQVDYARALWQALALTRAMETGLPFLVSDWAAGRHAGLDVDVSVGSVHAPGMTYDTGILHRRGRDKSGPLEPTATAHTSARPALGGAVHYTAGGGSICDPGQRPDIARVHRVLPRGEDGVLIETIDLAAAERYRAYRRAVGLLA